jgi:hypothetical protein
VVLPGLPAPPLDAVMDRDAARAECHQRLEDRLGRMRDPCHGTEDRTTDREQDQPEGEGRPGSGISTRTGEHGTCPGRGGLEIGPDPSRPVVASLALS